MYRVLLLFVLITSIGCTTIRGSRQRLKIATHPPGATVYEGTTDIGETPGFFQIDRQKAKSLLIRKKEYPQKTIDLRTSYRWSDSFFSNFVWTLYAPIGWGVDLLTGTAWNYKNVAPITLSTASKEAPKRPESISIAPPQCDFEVLSDELGHMIQEHLEKKYPKSDILPFASTQTKFAQYAYYNDEKTLPENRDNLYFSLATTHIAESEVIEKRDSVVVTLKIRDIYYGSTYAKIKMEIPNKKLSSLNSPALLRSLGSLVSLIPNTITFDAANSNSYVEASLPPYDVVHTALAKPSNTVLGFMSNFGIRNFKHTDIMNKIRFTVRIVPAFAYSYSTMIFDEDTGPTEFENKEFDWYVLKLGYGPEFGMETAIGFFYFQLIPVLSFHWLDWSRNSKGMQSTNNIMPEVEIGYSFFISDRFNLRFFGRWLTAPGSIWQTAFKEASDQVANVHGARHSSAGISLGYYFPEVKTWVKNTLR